MPPTLLSPDRQTDWAPVWVLDCSALPALYATRDLDVPGPPAAGDPFVVGDSMVGGPDLLGGGTGAQQRQAYARIIGEPTITRRLVDTFWGAIEVQDVSITLANADNALSGDARGATLTLSRYDAATGTVFVEWTGLISKTTRSRGTFAIDGTNVDLAILEQVIPRGTITQADFPLAAPDAIGATPAWIFGNVSNLPMPCVRDDLVRSEFDYLVCRNTAAAIDGVRRLTPSGANPFVDVSYIELEPFPGMGAVLKDGPMEDWASPTALGSWSIVGTGSVTKNQTAGQFEEGTSSADLSTAAAAAASLIQDCHLNTTAAPITWWRGRTVELRARVRATLGARVQLQFADGVGIAASVFHTGSGLFETLVVTRVLDAAATLARPSLTIIAGPNTTAQFDNVILYLKAFSWAEVLRRDLYDGYTALRFFFRQDDTSGSLYQIVADVHGLQLERNPVRAVRTMLADPTHGLGKATDPASFDAAERAICQRYEDLVLLDAPQLVLTFDRCGSLAGPGGSLPASFTLPDASGYGRTATVTNAGALANEPGIGPSNGFTDFALLFNNDASAGTIPYTPAFDPTSEGWTIEVWYRPAVAPGLILRPIVEKLVGAAAFSGLSLVQGAGGTITCVVVASGGSTNADIPLTAADAGADLYVCARVVGGTTTLTVGRGGVLTQAIGAYAGTLPTGDGAVRFGAFGTGGGLAAGLGTLDNLAVYHYALSDTVVQAHALGHLVPSPGEATPTGFYDAVRTIAFINDPLRVYYYRLAEASGVTMLDSNGTAVTTNGTYSGAPHLGVPGPLNPRMVAIGAEDTQVSFENRIFQFGVVTGRTFSGTTLGLLAWYTPDVYAANSGIVDKTIAGATNTSSQLFQQGNEIHFRVKPTTTTFIDVIYPMTAADVGRPMMLLGFYDNGRMGLIRNGVLVATAAYIPPVAVGVGDLYIGKLGSSVYNAQGDIGQVVIFDGYTGEADASALFLAGTWYPGGLLVDLAMTEARQAQDWLRQVMQLRGIRLGFTATGVITCTVDAAPPDAIRLHARDGAGDGERTLVDIRDRQRPGLQDAVRDVVIQYRRDLLTGNYLGERRRAVSTRLDAQGRRIGRDKLYPLEAIREHPAADRVACYLAARLALDETVQVTLHQEARQLVEGDLVQVTDAAMGYADAIVEVQQVEKALTEIHAELREWDAAIYTYVPQALDVGAGPG